MNIFSGSTDKTSKPVLCNKVLDLNNSPVEIHKGSPDSSIVVDNSGNLTLVKSGKFYEIDEGCLGFIGNLDPSDFSENNKGEKIMSGEYSEDERIFVGYNQEVPDKILYEEFISIKECLCGKNNLSEHNKSILVYNKLSKLSDGKDLKELEILNIYFRKLHNVFCRKDGTFYSKVVDGKTASDVIDSLIKVYPWKDFNPNNKKEEKEESVKIVEESGNKIADISKLIEVVQQLSDRVNNLLKSFD